MQEPTTPDAPNGAMVPTKPAVPEPFAERPAKTPIPFELGKGFTPVDFDGLYRFASQVANSSMCPKSLKQGPATIPNIIIACAQGAELGLSLMQSLQSIAVINGMPAIYGDAGLALVHQHGLVEVFIEAVVHYCSKCRPGQLLTDPEGVPELLKQLEATNKIGQCQECKAVDVRPDDYLTAVCISSRKGGGLRVSSFSVQDAKRAKLWGKQGPWQEYPHRMLMWRARGFNLRDQFGDVLKGLHSYEEARDQPQEPEPSKWAAPEERPSAGLIPTESTNIIDVKPEPQKPAEEPSKKRGPGRPKGSANKEKEPEESRAAEQTVAAPIPGEEEEPPPPPDPLDPGSEGGVKAPAPTPPAPTESMPATDRRIANAPLLTLPANFGNLEPGDRTIIWLDKVALLETEEQLKAFAALVQKHEPDGGAVREAIKPEYIKRGKAIRGIK